jgi:TonB-like protein
MIPAFALIGILAAGHQADGNQVPQPGATDTPVVTCEVKNPDPSSSMIQMGAVDGADLAEWLKKFVAQVRRNFFVPLQWSQMRGCASMSFKVAKDGAMRDIVLQHPSATPELNLVTKNAIEGSNPTWPLPQEYRGEPISFTVTFFFPDTPTVEK